MGLHPMIRYTFPYLFMTYYEHQFADSVSTTGQWRSLPALPVHPYSFMSSVPLPHSINLLTQSVPSAARFPRHCLPRPLVLCSSSQSSVLRVLRVVRVMRVFKLSRYVSWIKLLAGALAASMVPLTMSLCITGLGTLLFGSALFYLEEAKYSDELGQFIGPNGKPR